MIDVSIVIPSVRIQHWPRIIESLSAQSCQWEVIFIGPTASSGTFGNNVKYIEDYGAPTRCVQLAAEHALGDLLMWSSDDGLFHPENLANAVNHFRQHCKNNDEMTMRYTEAPKMKTETLHHEDKLWTAEYHNLHKNAGVSKDFKIAPLGMLKLEYFRELGGFDCKYEHMNLSCLDLCFRIQKNGGVLHLSPDMVQKFDFNPKSPECAPVLEAFHKNDWPLFQKHYSDEKRDIKLPYDNWKSAPEIWHRRKFNE